MEKITLRKIADELGVSIGTVDRALHNRSNIKKETKEAVLELIKQYNYIPDRNASSLSRKKTKTRIGVILHSYPEFYWNCVQSGLTVAGNELRDFGLEIIYKKLILWNIEELILKIDELIAEKIDAIILVPINDPLLIKSIDSAFVKGIPIVTIDDDINDSKRIFYVGPQMMQSGIVAGELMGKFLYGKGNIVIVSGNYSSSESYVYHQQIEGFRKIINQKYKDINIVAMYSYDFQSLKDNLDNMIKGFLDNISNVSGIYDADGASLSNIGEYVKYYKIKDIVVIGHEIWSKVETLMSEGIIQACISQDPYSQGYYAIKYLYDYLVYGNLPYSERMNTRIEIILRENLTTQKNIINPYLSRVGSGDLTPRR
ncbi:MAG: LacI family DNA-binding transcriptional regulator [Bacillota bacterium]|nr:LacI family DNA-binding transcriptional regulator [Bacillota bacterium]